MAKKFHLSDNGPAPCNANTRPCPVKGPDGSTAPHGTQQEMEKVYAQRMEAEHGTFSTVTKIDQEAHQIPSNKTLPDSLDLTDERIKDNQFRAPKYPEHIKKLIGTTKDGAPLPKRQDGAVVLPAGDYVYVSAESWEPFANKDTDAKIWNESVYANLEDGDINGAYLNGKPAYLVVNASSSETGYVGEVLVAKETYEEFKKRPGYFENEAPQELTVRNDTVLYGEFGDPSSPMTKEFFSGKDYEDFSEDLQAALEGEKEWNAPGSIYDHPEIKFKK